MPLHPSAIVGRRDPARARRRAIAASTITIFALAVSGCGASPGSLPTSSPAPSLASPAPSLASPAPSSPVASPAAGGTITLYSTVTQATVESVVAAYQAAHPGVTVEVFRAPTGEVAARIAAELREGGLRADLLWLTDPLSIEPYAREGLLATDVPAGVEAIDPADQTETSWGTRLLNMVLVTGVDPDPALTDWSDLLDPGLSDAVALPDPAFAGSAFGLLGYFADAPSYGMAFYQQLKDNGAVIVNAPDEVTTGVAEGRFKAGVTLDFSARSAVAKGSPVELVWPASGAVTMYSPIAAVAASDNPVTARSFIDYVLSLEGQALIATSGWQPARTGVVGGPPIDGLQVRPDWASIFGRQEELLAEFRAIYGE